MEENLHSQVDKLFRESLQSWRDDPSEEVWKKIENKLDEEDLWAGKANLQRRIWLAIGLPLLLVGLATITLLNFRNIGNNKGGSVKKFNDGFVRRDNLPGKNPKTLFSKQTSILYNPARNAKILQPYELNTISPDIGNSQVQSEQADKFIQDNGLTWPQDITALEIRPLHIEKSNLKNYPDPAGKIELTHKPDISENAVIKLEKHSLLNRFSLTPYFSQEILGYNLTDDDATAADGHEIEKRERNVFSASLGVYVNFRINKKWLIQSGVSYSWSNSIIDSSKSFAVVDNSGNIQFKLNTISGYGFLQPTQSLSPVVGDSIYTAKAYSQLHYLTIPLIVSYRIPMKRFSLLVGAGVSVNFLTSARVETNIYGPGIDQESVISLKGLKNINYGIIFKADLEYHFSNVWGINIIPCFKNALSPINIHSALSAYPYNFGLGAGITYRF